MDIQSFPLEACQIAEGVIFQLFKWWSDQISRSVMSDSSRPHESQHARPPYPSPTPGVHPNHVHQVSNAIQPSHPLSSPFPPAPNPSQHQSLFQWVNSSHEVAKVLEFQLYSISPSKEHPVMISFRMDWLDCLAVQGTLKSLFGPCELQKKKKMNSKKKEKICKKISLYSSF